MGQTGICPTNILQEEDKEEQQQQQEKSNKRKKQSMKGEEEETTVTRVLYVVAIPPIPVQQAFARPMILVV